MSLKKTRRRQSGGNFPFFTDDTKDKGTDEHAELEKEKGHMTAAMVRIRRRLEGYERKLASLAKQTATYEGLTEKYLKMYETYESTRDVLSGKEEVVEDLDEDLDEETEEPEEK